jgi:hypothetical protein
MKRFPASSVVAALVAAACGDAAGPGTGSSFSRLQRAVFDPQCVTCHTAGHDYAGQSGLVLDPAVAYDNLVSVLPTNPAAREDGLLRVKPGVPDSSLLLHKLHWEPDHHQRDYGSPMPLGGQSLSVGQIEFVRRWIAAGAPRATDEIDPQLLEDDTPPNLEPFVPLAPPETGYQLHLERFGVAPQFERELFVYQQVGNATDVFVNRIEIAMRPNSHHFVLYSFADDTPDSILPPLDAIRDIRNPNGTLNFANMRPMPYHVFFTGSMSPRTEWQFPDGVALRAPAHVALDLNSHYVNRTEAEIPGEVYVNLHTVDPSAVLHVASALNLSNFGILLPPNQRTTLTKTFLMSEVTTVFMLTSHMHEHGERFVIRIAGGPRDGEKVYETDDWDHPAIVSYDPPIVLEPGEGLTSEITYNNTTARTITFGLTSQDEMGIIFGYFYR